MVSNVELTGLAKDLADRAKQNNPVRIGLVGAGEMGTDIAVRVKMMDGVQLAAIIERTPEKALIATELAFGEPGHAQSVTSLDDLNSTIEQGKTAITESADLMLQSGLVDVVVDATGVPSVGAEFGLAAMQHGKHLVMMNVEADVAIGPILRHEADKHGVVYSLAAGDEPSSCMEIIEFLTTMGHRIICAGKGKNNPLCFDAVPDDYQQEAEDRNMNPRMLVEFVDGSKTMVEMTAIANATGLIPDCDGMHGPSAAKDEIASVLIPTKDGGILSEAGRVDFTVGKGVAPGVFVVAEAEHPRILERLRDLKIGKGPYFTFIRPYHLTSLEAPLTCARAVLYGKADMMPLQYPVAQASAVAKRDLAIGETLKQIGETDYRAWAMDIKRARLTSALPAALLTSAKTIQPIHKGELLTTNNVQLDEDEAIVKLWRRQEQLVFGASI